jgi:hypothetical protein
MVLRVDRACQTAVGTQNSRQINNVSHRQKGARRCQPDRKTTTMEWGSLLCRGRHRGGSLIQLQSEGNAASSKTIHFEPHIFTCQRALPSDHSRLVARIFRQNSRRTRVSLSSFGFFILTTAHSFEFGRCYSPDRFFLSSGTVAFDRRLSIVKGTGVTAMR